MTPQRYKYPRTPHLPWSPGVNDDDIRNTNTEHFAGKSIVVTEKMDGENTTLYSDYIHARSIDGRHHVSRDWVKRLHAQIAYLIPEGYRACGENLYARHAIEYSELESYFYLFSIWNASNHCLCWRETVEWSKKLRVPVPKVLYEGSWDATVIQSIEVDVSSVEGYVIRLADSFHYTEFSRSVAKWVRPAHVQTDTHWMHQAITPNQLRSKK